MPNTFLALLIDHHAWANGVLLLDAETLSHDELDRHFEIGPGSMHDTLRHIIAAMRTWTDRIGGRPVRASIEDGDQRFDLRALRTLHGDADADLRSVAAEIDHRAGWAEVFELMIPGGGPTYRFTRAAAILHLLTHGMHHRAQLLNIRRRLGRPSLGLDLDVVEWEALRSGQIQNTLALAALAAMCARPGT